MMAMVKTIPVKVHYNARSICKAIVKISGHKLETGFSQAPAALSLATTKQIEKRLQRTR